MFEMNQTDSKIIPDKILDNLICQKCFSYLTVLPVTLLSNGLQLCGRCTQHKTRLQNHSPTPLVVLQNPVATQDVEYTIPIVLYAYASSQTLFPCINRYEGCPKYLTIDQIEFHEASCVVSKTKCPKCEFRGVASQFIQHFKHIHREYYKGRADFTLNHRNIYNNIFLYRRFNVILIVNCLYLENLNRMLLEVFNIAKQHCEGVVKINLELKCEGQREKKCINIISKRIYVDSKCSYNISFNIGDCFDVELIDCVFVLEKFLPAVS
ncbi:uncharacterized protein LOC115880635 [Sitophilus oryzae]|uniref:Uncharacterized protein LOC115880635 n=1 Tax=Sitophilus oryzae TaxID=7048 RepID=A0A6J2XQJ4_SITOR|nr:uncharacterized protein LOC115880635 [Sitophilus oryzae]